MTQTVIPSEVEESKKITVDERAKLAVGEIEDSLPNFSKRGSGDDISLAGYVCVEEVVPTEPPAEEPAVTDDEESQNDDDEQSSEEVLR